MLAPASLCKSSLMKAIALYCLLASSVAAAADSRSHDQQRLDAKPWILKNIQVGPVSLPISPVTLLAVWLFVSALYKILWKRSPKSSVVASHILHQDKALLEQLKTQIHKNPAVFANLAREHSSCPSKHQGGSLGRFDQGNMAPPFDQLVFGPQTPLQTTVGPVQTQFGWHLIYVHERKLVENTNNNDKKKKKR
jgi:peptidyl-prolyl cis-trans isomerase C